MKNNNVKGIVFSLFGGIFWGLAGACGQYITHNCECSAGWMCCYKMLAAGFIMLVAAFVRDRKHFFDIFKNKKDFISLIIFALCGMMLCQYTFFLTIEMSNSATASALQYLCPILILIYTCFKEKEKPELKKVICVLMAFFGVLTLVTHLKLNSLVLSPKVVACGLFSALFYAMLSLQPKGIIKKYSVLLMNGYGLFLAGIFMLPVARPWKENVNLGVGGIIAFAFVVFGGTILANAIYQAGVKSIGAQKANLYACVEPIATLVFSVIWLKSKFTPMDLLGFACIIAAVIWLSLPTEKKGRLV